MTLRVVAAPDSPDKPVVHIGISKRVMPLAVDRNRLKRLIREALRRVVRPAGGALYRVRIEKVPSVLDYPAVERALTAIFK